MEQQNQQSKQQESAAEKQLKAYLDKRAEEDDLFAKRYASEKKSIAECIRYIKGEAYKQAIDNGAFLTDDEVYGLAVHYYDEDDIVINRAPTATMGVSQAASHKVELSAEDKTKAEEEAKRKAYEELVEQQRQENIKAAASLKPKKQKAESPSLFATYDYETEE